MKIFDVHFHIIDYKYPVVENNGYLPSKFLTDDYFTTAKKINVVGGAIVSGSFQVFDQNEICGYDSPIYRIKTVKFDLTEERIIKRKKI